MAPGGLEQLIHAYSYLGMALISFVGSSSVIIPIPYTLFIVLFGAVLNPLAVALSAAVGSAAGEMVGYAMGYFGRAAIPQRYEERVSAVMKAFERYGSFVIFLFALTPLPDDLLFIPLGIMRYGLVKALVPCLLGKLGMSLTLAYFGSAFGGFLAKAYAEAGWVGTLITLAALALIVYAMLSIEWEKYLLPKPREAEP